MNPDVPYKILFICTGNSARSIFGEYIIKRVSMMIKRRIDLFCSLSFDKKATGRKCGMTRNVVNGR